MAATSGSKGPSSETVTTWTGRGSILSSYSYSWVRAPTFTAPGRRRWETTSCWGTGLKLAMPTPLLWNCRDSEALTAEEQVCNLQISRGRMMVEQTFGRVNCKWRRVRDLHNTRLDIVVMVIMAACILRNLCTGCTEGCEDHLQGCPRQADENV